MTRFGKGRALRADTHELLRDNSLAMKRRIELVRAAKKSVYGTLYYVKPDASGLALMDELTAAAKRGVTVVVGIDSFAQRVRSRRFSEAESRLFADSLAKLRRAGGVVSWFGGTKVHLKNPGVGVHLKTLVGDGQTAVLDGRNIGESSLTDFGARVTGPLAQGIAAEALSLLKHYRPYRKHGLVRRGAELSEYRDLVARQDVALRTSLASKSPPKTRGPKFVFVTSGRVLAGDRGHPNKVTSALTSTFKRAAREITLSSNFVHGTKELRTVIINAAKRGVRVRILTTGIDAAPFAKMPHRIASAHYQDLIDAGCEIYETRKMEHGKMYVVDGTVAAFGSYNVSKWSHARNHDGLLFTADRHTVREISGVLDRAISQRATRVRTGEHVPTKVLDRVLQWATQ